MALLLAGAIALTPSCDSARDGLASALEGGTVEAAVARLEEVLRYCDPPEIERVPRTLEAQPPEPKATAQSLSPDQGMGSNVEQWRGLVEAYFPAGEVEKAMAVMACESGGNPNADNPSSSAAGLFQFLKSTWDNMVPIEVTGGSYSSGQVYDPEANVRAAAWLLAAEGWSQWSCA